MGVDDGRLKDLIRDVPDFPKPGVVFKDLTPLLADAAALAMVIEGLALPFIDQRVDQVIGVEARGFIVAAPVAHRLGAGFIPVRKPGKLPWETVSESYELEYGIDSLEIHGDALLPGQRALVVDDVLATGGTASATVRLTERLGAEVVGLAFIIELAFLDGRRKLPDRELVSLLTYE